MVTVNSSSGATGPAGNDLLIPACCATTRPRANSPIIPATATITNSGSAFLNMLVLFTGPVCLCG